MERFGQIELSIEEPTGPRLNPAERKEKIERTLRIISLMVDLRHCCINFRYITGPVDEVSHIAGLIRECNPVGGYRFLPQPGIRELLPLDPAPLGDETTGEEE